VLDDSNIVLDPSCFPPCAMHVLRRIRDGVNLAHYERLFIVSFCSFAGMDPASIANLFRAQPDFNEQLTLRQVASIIGTDPGQKAKYKPANCARLLSVSMCFKADDPACNSAKRPVSNPMIAYKRKLYFKANPAKPQAAKAKPTRKARADG
jgi:DNA primase large subunit